MVIGEATVYVVYVLMLDVGMRDWVAILMRKVTPFARLGGCVAMYTRLIVMMLILVWRIFMGAVSLLFPCVGMQVCVSQMLLRWVLFPLSTAETIGMTCFGWRRCL